MKTKELLISVTLFSLLLASCKAVRTETNRTDMSASPTQVLPFDTTPFPSAVPGQTPASAKPPTPVPAVSIIPSTTTPARPISPGWTAHASINEVYELAFAPDGTLWAITQAGLVHWDLSTETYTRYQTQARDIAVAPDGSLWLATDGGLCHFTVNTGDGATCRNYTTVDGLIHDMVRAVAVAPDGTVWIGTQAGVSRFSDPAGSARDGAPWTNYPAPVPTEDLSVAPNGEVWHATSAGVGRYIPSQDSWMTYSEEHGLPSSHAQIVAIGPQDDVWTYILWQGVYRVYLLADERWEAVGEIPNGIVGDIAIAPDGTPWIGLVGGMHYPGGSLVYGEGDGWTDVTAAHGLRAIRAVALGPDGAVAASTNLGLGIYQDGAWRLLRDGPSSDRVTAVAVTPDGAAWFGFGDQSTSTYGAGLARFDGEAWSYYLDDAEVSALAVAPDGELWAGVGCDVQRFDGATWETVGHCEDDLPLGSVLDIAFTSDGATWVANGFGLARFDGESWQRYEKLVYSLVAAPDGGIWMNGWEGTLGSGFIAYYDGENWRSYPSVDLYPGGFAVGAVTNDGRVWGVVPERGLVCFADPALTLGPVDSAEGRDDAGTQAEDLPWSLYPPPDRVSLLGLVAVAPDGALWLRTENGVARFDPAADPTIGGESAPGDPWTIYTQDDGLVGKGSVMALGPNHEIWLGSTLFRPAESDGIRQSAPTAPAPQTSDLRWDTNPAAHIVRYYSPYTSAGLAGAYDRNYYIPEVQVWGDGRIIWVERARFVRHVLACSLTREQMQALIQSIVDAGFFGWEDEYYTLGGNSFPAMHLAVNLISASKEVVEHGGAPDGYYELQRFLTRGAGCTVNHFVPTRGFLTAALQPIEATGLQWPDATAGVTLDQVGDGIYVEGEALDFAWRAVNTNPTAPVYVESNGNVYAIMIQIPGVSFFEPPT